MKLERWQTNLYTLWVTQIFSMVGFGLGVPFIPYYLQEMGVGSGAQLDFLVGLSSTLPAATMAIFSPIWGRMSDIYGRKMMLMRAMAGATVILVCYGFCKSVVLFMILRALHGVFTGTVSAAMTFVSANTPSHKMSYALGFLTSSNFLGYALGPVLGGFLVEIIGYSSCFFVGAAVMFTGCMLVFLLVKEDPNSYGRSTIEKNKKEGSKVEKSLADGNKADEESDNKEKKTRLITVEILAAFAVLFFVRLTRSVFTPFVPLFVQNRLGTMVGAATYTGFINGAIGVGTALAAVTLARLGDKHNKYKVVLLFTCLSLAVSVLLLPKYALAIFCGVYALYFFVCGAVEPILTSLISEKTDAHHRGTLFGILGALNSVAMMSAPMVGTAISVIFSYEAILYCIPLFTLIQGMLLLTGRKKLGRDTLAATQAVKLAASTESAMSTAHAMCNESEADSMNFDASDESKGKGTHNTGIKTKDVKKMQNEKFELHAKCSAGEITIKELPITDVDAVEKIYGDLMITKDNYKEKLGIQDYDNFYSFGGKYNRFTAEDFGRMVVEKNWVILAAYHEDKICGAIWASLNRGYFVDMSLFHFKKEYGGVGRIWAKYLEGAGIANNLETVCEPPENFPSALAVMHYAMIRYCIENDIEVSVSELYKNISCDTPEGTRNLDTFNYSSYNAYKMLGYEHVGYLPQKQIEIADGTCVVTVEPQLIAGLDLQLQIKVIEKILAGSEITIE